MQIPPELLAVQARSTLHETPCGSGSIAWRRWGAADAGGPPVVLLHGGSGSWNHWLRNIDALTEAGRAVWAADLPGMGDSAKPPSGGDADVLPAPLAAGLKQLLGGRPCDLVGFSFGGLAGGLMTADYPELVHKLVLVGAPVLGVPALQALDFRTWRGTQDDAQRRAIHRHNLHMLMLDNPAAIDELAVSLQDMNTARDRMTGRRLARTDALYRAVRRVQCPLYAIYGRRDVLFSDRLDALAEAVEGAPDFRGLTLIPDAGHWVHYEQAQAFNAALLRALEED